MLKFYFFQTPSKKSLRFKQGYLIIVIIVYFSKFRKLEKMAFFLPSPRNPQYEFKKAMGLLNNSLAQSDTSNMLRVLNNQRKTIQTLLERQKILNINIRSLSRVQTTDTQHYVENGSNFWENRLQTLNQGSQKGPIFVNKNEQKFCTFMEKTPTKRNIQIISTCSELSEPIICLESQNEELIENKENQPICKELKKKSQTKNLIKNFGKSVLIFVKRKPFLIKKILKIHGMDQSQFQENLLSFRNKLNSIVELKLFWADQQNKFTGIFRIISNIYLREHSLEHIFQSRVKNHAIHIKYRHRLIQMLKNPLKFNSIKYQ